MSELKLKRLWLFDCNRRVYRKAPAGRLWDSSGPIYREHWVEHKVIGENRVSWIIEGGRKITKKGGHGICFTPAEVDDQVWIHEHRHNISSAIRDCLSAPLLREVARIIGYEPPKS